MEKYVVVSVIGLLFGAVFVFLVDLSVKSLLEELRSIRSILKKIEKDMVQLALTNEMEKRHESYSQNPRGPRR